MGLTREDFNNSLLYVKLKVKGVKEGILRGPDVKGVIGTAAISLTNLF